MKPDTWVRTGEGLAPNSKDTKEDALSCFRHCAKYREARYFEWVYPNRTGEHADKANTCYCKQKEKDDGEFESCGDRCSISGYLACGGFYIGRLVKSTRRCQHDDPNEKCEYFWEDGDKVEEEVLDQGFTYDFERNTSKTEFKCTYMEKDIGIV